MKSFVRPACVAGLCILSFIVRADERELRRDVQIPMRDGITLNGALYLPPGQSAAAPCIFTLTPYISDSFQARGVYFSSHGYPFTAVDVRGRGKSQGEFQPFIQEAKDGYDIVEWLAGQPYCDGNVAMFGSSYGGYDQWATAKEFPPHLKTIVPTASPYPGFDYPMRNNIAYPYVIQWITSTSGHKSQSGVAGDAFWSDLFMRWDKSGLPFNRLDQMSGVPSRVYQEWLTHPQPDSYWDAHNPTVYQYRHFDIPILTITGAYDDDQPGALQHYRQFMRYARPAARAGHFLVIGPWDHGGTARPQAQAGGVSFGPASLLDLAQLHADWYAWTMRGAPPPEFLRKHVAYYVAVADVWRYADALEEVGAHSAACYLDSRHNATDISSPGSLGPSKGRGPADFYQYDPRDPDAPEIEAENRADDERLLVDQTVVRALGGRELVYQTTPFAKDVEVSGFFKLSAWIGIDRPDTDLYVAIYEIDAAGGSIRLTNDAIRARYRQGLRSPQAIQTHAAMRYDFDQFTFVSRLIKQGHRLRLVISPVGRLIESKFIEKNYNGGGVVAAESAKEGWPVTVTLYHDRKHASALYIPLG